jgi:hypothetical protein
MAAATVQVSIGGVLVNLSYQSTASGVETWTGTFTAPNATSYNANTDHEYHGSASVVDQAGNGTSADLGGSGQFDGLRVLETVAPTGSFTSPSSGATIADTSPTYTLAITDTGTSTAGSGVSHSSLAVTLDGTAATPVSPTWDGDTVTFTLSGTLSDASHTVAATFADNDGNSGSASATFVVESAAPTLSISAPTDGMWTNHTTLTISGSTQAPSQMANTVTWDIMSGTSSVENGTFTVGTDGTFSVSAATSGLSDGDYTVKVTATNAAGTATTISRTIHIDRTAPIIRSVTFASNPTQTGTAVTVTVTVTD